MVASLLISECVYLKKPILVIPIQGQFEQTLNGFFLSELGYGAMATEADVQTLRRFMDSIETCQGALAGYQQHGNGEIILCFGAVPERCLCGPFLAGNALCGKKKTRREDASGFFFRTVLRHGAFCALSALRENVRQADAAVKQINR